MRAPHRRSQRAYGCSYEGIRVISVAAVLRMATCRRSLPPYACGPSASRIDLSASRIDLSASRSARRIDLSASRSANRIDLSASRSASGIDLGATEKRTCEVVAPARALTIRTDRGEMHSRTNATRCLARVRCTRRSSKHAKTATATGMFSCCSSC